MVNESDDWVLERTNRNTCCNNNNKIGLKKVAPILKQSQNQLNSTPLKGVGTDVFHPPKLWGPWGEWGGEKIISNFKIIYERRVSEK